MEFRIANRHDDGKSTQGELLVDGQHFCYTLEPSESDTVHPAIPGGTYNMEMRFSPRFQQKTPHILDVPGRSLILVHPGNYPNDTEGCLLVGETESRDFVGSSRVSFIQLNEYLLKVGLPRAIIYDPVNNVPTVSGASVDSPWHEKMWDRIFGDSD